MANNNNNNNDDEERQNRVRVGNIIPLNMWTDANSELEWKSWIIPTFLMLNIVMFIVTMHTNNCPRYNLGIGHDHSHGACFMRFLGRFSFENVKINPLLGPSSQTLLKMGGVNGATIAHNHQAWRLMTSIWLHTGLIHLLVSMLSLMVTGIRLEQQFGFVRTTAIYVLAGFGGNIVACLFDPNHVSVGASSALLGLIGSMFSELLTNWTLYTNKVAAVITLTTTLIINVVVVVVPYHGHFSHVSGGFITGFLLGFVLLARPHIGWVTRHNVTSSMVIAKYKPYQYGLGLTSLVFLIIGNIVGLVLVFKAKAKYY